MLKQRILTALILAPFMLAALFGLNDQLLLLLVAVILLGGGWEWANLAGLQNRPAQIAFLGAQAGMMGFAWWLLQSHFTITVGVLVSAVLGWFIILYWLSIYERSKLTAHLSIQTRVVLGLLLLPITFLSIAFILATFANDRLLLLLLFLLIWGADIAAYFAGRAFGKHKLAPTISPGKTWQGVFGELLMTVVIASVAWYLLNYPGSLLPKLIVLLLLVVSLSIVGDLLESLLKRQAGVKDSSHLLPGHGGVLDRIDSMIAACPVYALGMYLLGVS